MFTHKSLKRYPFAARPKVIFPTGMTHRWEFVRGALSNFLSRSYTAAGYPVDAKYQQYSTARINTNSLSSRQTAPREVYELYTSSRTQIFNLRRMKSLLKLVILLLSMIIIGVSSFLALTGTGNRFSSKQVESYMQIVGSKLEEPNNWKTDTGTFSVGKTSCYPVVLGEGDRNGAPGVYTWFTCSGIHNVTLAETGETSFSCTGFSWPVWIAPNKKSINYETASSAPAYYALLNTAPAKVQNLMDRNYNLVNQRTSNQIIDRAALGTQPKNIIGNQSVCS